MTYRNLTVLAAAEEMVVEVVKLFDEPRPPRRRLLFKAQTLGCAESVPGNIGEAFGRQTIADRNRALGIACVEAEETIRHLEGSFSQAVCARTIAVNDRMQPAAVTALPP